MPNAIVNQLLVPFLIFCSNPFAGADAADIPEPDPVPAAQVGDVLAMIPDPQLCQQQWQAGHSFITGLGQIIYERGKFLPEWRVEELRAWQNEAAARLRFWDHVWHASFKNNNYRYRRWHAFSAVEMIGAERWNAGDWPGPIPLCRGLGLRDH